jgi:hypothetical protein
MTLEEPMTTLDYAAYYETCVRRRGLARRLRQALAWTVWGLVFLARPDAARAIRGA